jgi:hypothetical protein
LQVIKQLCSVKGGHTAVLLIELWQVNLEKLLHGDNLPNVDLLTENTRLVCGSRVRRGNPDQWIFFGPWSNQLKGTSNVTLVCWWK